MAEEKKGFYPFTIKPNAERQKKIDELKKKYNMSSIMKVLLELGEEASEEEIDAKILHDRLLQELGAMDIASDDNNYLRRKKKYEEGKKYKDGLSGGGKIDEISEYYKKFDEWDKKGLDHEYENYEQLCADIELNQSDEAKKQQKLQEAREQYKDTIQAHDELKSLEQKRSNYYEAFDLLERLPDKTRQSLLLFYKDCRKKGKDDAFNDALAQLACEKIFFPYKDENDEIVNNHKFDLDDKGHIRHSIYNLNNTGLDICMVDNKFSFAHCPSNLTEEQIAALAEYCLHNGISIEDYYKLSELKVLDKDGKEIGTAASELEKRLSAEENTARDVVNEQVVEAPQDAEHTGTFAEFLPPVKPLDVSRKKMVDAAKKRIGLMGFPPESDRLKISRGFNSTIISVYANENDRLADGEVDKNGKRQHTKQFAVELINSVPPKARVYMGQAKEFTADHARLALDAFKACGSKYFVIPSVDQIGGKPVGGAFMKASVKTTMVPLLKASENGIGCHIGLKDLNTILEEAPKEEALSDAKAKAEYYMRWYEQLETYTKWNSNAAKSFGTVMEKFRLEANFASFASSGLQKLEQHITDGMTKGIDGKKWDNIDQVTATIAMVNIIKDIKQGKLDGKPYNPLGNNEELLLQALNKYMAKERPLAEERIMKQYLPEEQRIDSKTGEEARKDSEKDRAMKNEIGKELKQCKDLLDATLKDLESDGGPKLAVKIMSAVNEVKASDMKNKKSIQVGKFGISIAKEKED